ncbi:mandelate racemase/muconate lactonizing enzyme family protein, partial [Mycobacterium tuberculosis]|nr:mandelate racemase/muconate lactonizing enzyme family protein [Mycobacterium tuberculosis]
GPDVTIMGAVSALEMACWDIIGKEADKPVYELLGGRVHERLRSYTYLYPKPELGETSAIYWNAEASAERAAEYVAQGYTAVK